MDDKNIEQWKQENLIIGYICGKFDELSLSTIQTLKFASQHCDKLIIGLDTDYIIKMKHSVNEPKNDYQYRLHMLETLEYADLILPVEELSSIGIISKIKPNKVFMKSDSHDFENIKEIVESYKGELVLLDTMFMDNKSKDIHKDKAIITGLDQVLVDLSTKKPNYNNLYLINMLKKEGYKILVITSKSENDRNEIHNWLSKYIEIDKLYMRTNNITNTAKIKEEIYHNFIENHYDIDFVFDSDEDNCEMWTKYNLNCMYVL